MEDWDKAAGTGRGSITGRSSHEENGSGGVIAGLLARDAVASRSRFTEYKVPVANFLEKILATAEQEGDHLLYSSVAWNLGQDLIGQQEYERAAECFRCVLRVAELSSERFFVEAARVAERLCTALCHEHPAGEQLWAARAALGKNLLRLSYEDVGLAEATLAAFAGSRVAHQAPSGFRAGREAGAKAEVASTSAGAHIKNLQELPTDHPRVGVAAPLTQPHLQVRFFGNFEVSCNGEPLPLRRGGKAITILRYLLANRSHPVTQDYLMGWLWPESDLKRARWSLNSAIYTLRKLLNCMTVSSALPFDYILLEEDGYHLSPDVEVFSDTEEFDARCKEGYRLEKAGLNPEAVVEYEKATQLYRGDFLVEELYEEWTRIERERLADAYTDLLRRLAINYMETGQLQESVQTCYRALEKDRCNEDTHRLLMECYVRLGQRARALRQYRLCEQALENECGTTPSSEIRALYVSILKNGGSH